MDIIALAGVVAVVIIPIYVVYHVVTIRMMSNSVRSRWQAQDRLPMWVIVLVPALTFLLLTIIERR